MFTFIKNLFGGTKEVEEPSRGYPLTYGHYSADPKRDLSGHSLNIDDLYKIYAYTPPVTDCIHGNAEDLFSEGFKFFNPTDEKIEINKTVINGLNEVWAYYSFKELIKQIYRDKAVAGYSFVLIVKNLQGNRVLGFKPIDPRTMAIVSDISGKIYRFIQRINTSSFVTYEPQDILYFKNNKNIQNEVFGMSDIQSMLWDLEVENGAMLSNNYYFKNDAKPSTLYRLSDEYFSLSNEGKKEVIDMIQNKYSGAKNKHKPGIMSMVEEVKQLRLTPEGMKEMIDLRVFSRRQVYARFRRPEFMDSYTETVNNNNGTELRQNYWDNIKNEESAICEVFNRQFFNRIPELMGKVAIKSMPRTLSDQVEKDKKLAIQELKDGIITRLEYKTRFSIEITKADRQDPYFDKHIIYQGNSALLPEDIGIDPQPVEPITTKKKD